MWLKMMRTKNLGSLMETSLVDNKYRNSIIHGKGKVELRNYIK